MADKTADGMITCPACAAELGQRHPSGNWIVYPNPCLCPGCGADCSDHRNKAMLESLVSAAEKKGRKRK